MSLSPTNILQRLQQLKQWQESHEELLKRTKSLTNTSTASDYQTIEGLSEFDDETSPKRMRNWDSQVISPTKSFNELLEEKLAQDPGPENVASKPKKPFLRKGAGLERFKMNRPPQKRVKVDRRRTKSDTSVTPLRAPDLSIKPKATWCRINDGEEQVDRINAIVHTENKNEPGEQTLYERALEKELLIFEALEQRADNSSFCSTNSSVVRILSSTPSKIQPTILEEKRVHWESSQSEDEVIETNLEKEDIAEILLRLKSLATGPNLPYSEEEKWSSTEPSSENTSITSTDLEATLRTQKRDIGVGTDEQSSEICAICGDKLVKKISEYEAKIKEVLHDKNQINEIRKKLEQKEKDFMKKKREFEDERQDLLFEVETEKKKLQKEKQTFQMYMKDSQNRPTKKERQEISNLKQEVADLSETLKLKESKNGMTQARLRNQIKQLEKENCNMKDEIEKLTKENAKLSAAQKLKRKSSDSKILQEINKNVTKLTQQTSRSRKDEESEDEEDKTVQKTNKSLGNDDSGSKQSRNVSLLDREDSLLEMGMRRGLDLEAQYENTFRNHEVSKTPDKVEHTLEDGSKQVKYSNGNVKTVSPDGNFIKMMFFNGDKQETNLLDGTVKYYFSSKNICQTTYADGLEVVEFPEGVIEKRHKDGKSEVTLPDGIIQTTFPDGTQETQYTDGSIVKLNKNGHKILLLPNGQKEVETKDFKRREYPDGTVKILYPDGTQETKYSNGRVRIKDANGTLIMDTQS